MYIMPFIFGVHIYTDDH